VTDPPVVLDRLVTERGELVLRRIGEHYEVISNGTFLMDTRDGRSERLLVTAALAAHPAPRSVLIGGLGVGFSLAETLRDSRLDRVTVVEVEEGIVRWHRQRFGPLTGAALRDPRCTIEVADLIDHLRTTADRYDVICLDIDNGPDWTVTESNASLYDDAGTAVVASRLNPGGVMSVWSASPSPSYRSVLSRHFDDVAEHEVDMPRGGPDVVLVASGGDGVRRWHANRDFS
jgi:spermidine synthase